MSEHALLFLLGFDGRTHWYEGGYSLRFKVRRVPPSIERPHGLQYSFTLHAPDGRRLLGFDNAHAVSAPGSRFKGRAAAVDHWHRTEDDPGRPYAFVDVESLIDDFFNAAGRELASRGVPLDTIRVEG